MLNEDVRFQFINSRFPHIGQKLLALWGKDEVGAYLDGLLKDTRGGERSGFPKDISAALEELRTLHLKLHAYEPEPPPPVLPTDTLADNDNFKVVNARFPHIGKKLGEMWGGYAFSLFINELFNDTRGGTRQGFPKEISVALFRLMQDHDRQYPEVTFQAQDIWSLNNRIK